ncbi:MAG: zinc-binding dehydrogenase, partial [Anaerolineaceae bacterium]|nr:zinc-binding dehydrogenase [Anaerolineaceae bacterium]
VLVRVTHAVICGSDLHVLYEMPVEEYPFPAGFSGHECVGVVEESRSPVFQRGERVLVIPPQANAWVEYIVVEPGWLIPIPDHVPMEQAVLAQLLGCVIYTCKKLDNVLGKRVVVVGQGPAGILFSSLLRLMGARQIIGLDIVDQRLETAAQMGADHTINNNRDDPVEAVKELTQGQLADIVIEAVGKEETINLCPDLAHEFGELVLFGGPKSRTITFDFEKFLRKQLQTTSSAHTQQEAGLVSFRLAMDFIGRGRMDVAPLISHRFQFTDLQYAFDLAYSRQNGALKVLVNIGSGAE